MSPAELRARRDAILDGHVGAENDDDAQAAAHAFARVSVEIVSDGRTLDRPAFVAELTEQFRAFPDYRVDDIARHHADDVVVMECWISGTHRGWLRGLPPTHKPIRFQAVAVFAFADDRMVSERITWDSLTVLRQLGLADDPAGVRGRLTAAITHPLFIARAFSRRGLTR